MRKRALSLVLLIYLLPPFNISKNPILLEASCKCAAPNNLFFYAPKSTSEKNRITTPTHKPKKLNEPNNISNQK